MQPDERMTDLEGRFAFLDDMVQELNEVVAAQRSEIDRLQAEVQALRELVRSRMQTQSDVTPEPPPPHY